MRRSAWLWTSGLLLAALLLPAAALLRLFDCATCGGVYRRYQEQPAPGVVPHPTGCPACRDRGRLTLLARLKREDVDVRLRTLIQQPRGNRFVPAEREAALQSLLEADGRPLCVGKAQELIVVDVRFTRDPEQDRIVVTTIHLPPATSVMATWDGVSGAWLFDTQGRLLDVVAVVSSRTSATACLDMIRDPDPFSAAKDAVVGISVLDHSGERPTDISRHTRVASTLDGVRAWQLDIGDVPPAAWIKAGQAYFRVASGRFVLNP